MPREPSTHARQQDLAEAQVFLRERRADMDATLDEPEYACWPNASSVRRE